MAIGLKKFFQRTFWVNYTPPAINESNLNNIEAGITELDNRTVQLDTAKADLSIVNTLVKNFNVNEKTGIITITYQNGSTEEIQTNINQIAVNFDFDATTQQMILTLENGQKKYVDLSAFITNYEFKNSDTITFYVSTNGTLQAFVNNGSITAEMLEPNYLANIKVEVGKAETASASAEAFDANAQYEAKLAQSYAIGNSGVRENEDTDNAKYYCQKAQEVSLVTEATDKIAGIVKYDNDTIKKNSAGQLYADASVEVDGSTIQKNDENIIRIADALKTLIDNAVQQVQGKGLSSNDFTNALLDKLNGISAGANKTSITNNLLATIPGTALDAVQGKVLNDAIGTINTNLTSFSSLKYLHFTPNSSIIIANYSKLFTMSGIAVLGLDVIYNVSDAWTPYVIGTIESAFPMEAYQPYIFAINGLSERVNVYIDPSGNVNINPAGSSTGKTIQLQCQLIWPFS